MAYQNVVFPCGCDGVHQCPEAVRLWGEVNRWYELGCATLWGEDADKYEAAQKAYFDHYDKQAVK